jgi:hypothetical protein
MYIKLDIYVVQLQYRACKKKLIAVVPRAPTLLKM